MRSLSFFFGLYLYKELLELLHGRRQPMRSRKCWWYYNYKSINYKGVLNYIPWVPLYPKCLTFLRALRAYVLYILTYRTSLLALCAHMPYVLTCLRACASYLSFFYVPYVTSFFSRAYMPHLFTCFACLHFLRPLRALTFLSAPNFWHAAHAFTFSIRYGTTQNTGIFIN